ncbi:hypothetical protein [Janthinobacterium sp. CG_S6]|uniref:hypothetical protein n=1 Tax=Janthinobacterium sp. CG_S6 TaxID=3071707 RepID=UPI002E0076BB|nr:hypothetical protein [Janthinobacterium sp. CG_S6]
MDDQTEPILFGEKIRGVLQIISEVTMKRTVSNNTEDSPTRIERFFDRISRKEPIAAKIICGLAVIFLIFGLTAYISKLQTFFYLTIFVYCLILLVWVGVVCAVVVAGVPKVHRFIRSPYKPFMESVTVILERDMKYLKKLHMCDLGARQAVLAYYQNERNSMERRGSALSGSIDRIGLFPALATVAALAAAVSKLDQGKEFIYVIISVIPFFHMFNFSAIGMYQKMDRVITLLQLSIELADQEFQNDV